MFKETIIKAFANDGRFKDIRSDQRQAIALAEIAVLGNAQLVVPLPEGDEQEDNVYALDGLANAIELTLDSVAEDEDEDEDKDEDEDED